MKFIAPPSRKKVTAQVRCGTAGFWTLDCTTITGRSAVILRQHTTPFRPMIVPFDDLELVYQSLRTLEPPHTHKFPRVNAQDCKLGPIQPWDVKDFLRPGRGRASDIPVVVITAKDLTDEDRDRLNGGVERIIQKSNRDEMLRQLSRELTKCVKRQTPC